MGELPTSLSDADLERIVAQSEGSLSETHLSRLLVMAIS